MAKRKKRKQKTLHESLKAKLIQDGLFHGQKIVIQPRGEIKMSQVLLDFIEPYSQYWETKEELNKLLAVAVIAWNTALMPSNKRKEIIENTIEAVPPEIREDIKAIVEEMIQRKEIHFAHNKRMIVSYQVTMTRDGPHVTVASTLLP